MHQQQGEKQPKNSTSDVHFAARFARADGPRRAGKHRR
jgi:hypothetical protein